MNVCKVDASELPNSRWENTGSETPHFIYWILVCRYLFVKMPQVSAALPGLWPLLKGFSSFAYNFYVGVLHDLFWVPCLIFSVDHWEFLCHQLFSSVQFSSVQSLSRAWLFVSPWIGAHQPSLSITNSQSLLKHMSIESVMPSNHLILWRPLVLLPSIFPNLRVFSNESVLHLRWSKFWREGGNSQIKQYSWKEGPTGTGRVIFSFGSGG